MKKAICVLLAALLLSAFAYGQNAALSGKYYLSAMIIGDEEFDIEMLELIGLEPGSWYMEFFQGGKFTMQIEDEEMSGTYRVNGKTLTIIDEDGNADEAVIEGNTITLIGDDAEMVFTK